MSQVGSTTEDKEKLDPKVLAESLSSAFLEYYSNKKTELERRKLDIAALKARAGISESGAPDLLQDLIRQLYNE